MMTTVNDLNFPVGHERSHSVKLLFKFFCNNLYLGQWELARSCLSRLKEETNGLTTDIRNVLGDVVKYPFNRSISHGDVGSSHHLSWLCLQEFKQLLEDNEKEDKEHALLEKNCEFRLLLVEACGETSEHIIKDLYLYQKAVSQTFFEEELPGQPYSLTTDLLNFLQETLLENPPLGHSIIQAIYACSKHSQYKKNNENLQGLYIKSINSLLDKTTNSHLHLEETKDRIEKVFKLLSLYNPEEYQNYLSIRELFARFYELSVVHNPVIDRNKVLSVIIGRETTYLVEEFCKVEYDLETKYLLSTAGCPGDELSEEQKCLLGLVKQKDRKKQMRILFLMCIKKQQHFLKLVTETSVALIKMGQFELLKMLLEPEEFQPLKPLLLLHGWSYCHSCQTAKQLLDILWSEESTCFHPALEIGCSKLAYQIDLIQWCLDKTKPLVSEVALTNQHQRAADMFSGLESHSVLYVLHQSTRVASLNQQEVLEILKKSPLQNDKDGSNREKTRVKAVTFEEVKKETSGEQKETLNEQSSQSLDITIERWRDISIYSGYCAVRNVMDAIYFCIDYSNNNLMNPVHVKDYRSLSVLSNSDSSIDNVLLKPNDEKKLNFQDIYTKNVTEKLVSTRDYLSKLQPLTYRVEILQDIFSLLFVSHDCIQETAFYEDLGSEDENSEGESRKSSDNLGNSIHSEDGLTSPEANSPVVNDVSDYTTDNTNNGLKVVSSYDEPFEDSKKNDKMKKSTERHGSFTEISSLLQKVDKSKNETSNKSTDKLHINKTTDTQTDVITEYNSTYSTESSHGLYSAGFLNNEYLVRDILDMLKDALLDLDSALFQVRGSSPEKNNAQGKTIPKHPCTVITAALEEPLMNIVQCSVTKETLQSKITLLRRYISEANWKFQLVCHEKIPKQPGEVLLEPIIVSMEAHEEEICVDLLRQKERKRRVSQSGKRSPSRSSPVTLLESESHDSGNDSRRVKRSRSRSRSRSICRGKFPPGIISLMLSSPDTLLTMCIQRSNYNQASQVTKMLKLENSLEVVEVKFSQSYSSAVKKLHSLNLGTQKSVTMPTKPGQKLSMKALGSVAAAGVATVSVSSVADELLSLPKLPIIPHPKCQVAHMSTFNKCFNQENCSAMILFDLLCTGCRSWEMCNNMIDAIKARKTTNSSEGKKSGKANPEKSDKISKRLKDIWDICDKFETLLQMGDDLEGNQGQIGVKEVLSSFYKHSIQALLKIATVPLYPEDCMLYAKLLSDFKVYIDKVEHAFQFYGKLPVEGFIPKRQNSSPKTSPYSSPSSKSSPKASPTKSGDGNQSEKPVINKAMKNLIAVLKNEIPPGGLIQLFTSNQSRENVMNKDYLQNLYDHLKSLAIVLAESEAASKENLIIPKNYFKMLEEGPISTLGRLMFAKKMPPSKLEKMAKKLSLNLNHIIVHSCCPKIPSKQLPALTSGFNITNMTLKGSHIIMNQPASSQPSSTSNPETLVGEIMTKLLFLMKETAKQSNARAMFDISSAKIVVKTTEFADIITSTQKLQTSDLQNLKTVEEKLAFFGNLQNLMFIHMCLFLVEEALTNKEDDADTEILITSFTELEVIDQLLHLNMFSYQVGQMGIISLFDLKYLINRNGLLQPSEWNKMFENRISELDKDDPWSMYVPPPDPRLLFVTTNCTSISPAIQVLTPKLLKSQLQMAMNDYLDCGVSVNVDDKTVTIPQLLMWYKQDFSHQQMGEITAENEGIIHIIAGHMTGEKQMSLQELLQLDRVHSYSGENIDEFGRKELPFEVCVQSAKGEFLVAFDNSHLKQNQLNSRGHKRITSLPKNMDFSLSKSMSMTSSTSSFSKYCPKYSLTPVTLEYVKSECPLVATLVSLVCEDELDELEDQFAEDHFANEEERKKRTLSEISLVDIRSYRYQKLTDSYPTLKQHLLNYIIPIAGTQNEKIIQSKDPVLKFIISSISDKLKACMLTLHNSLPFQDVVKYILNSLIVKFKWLEIIHILQSFPSTILQNEPKYTSLMDLSLGNVIYDILSRSVSPNRIESDEILKSFKHFCDPTKACHILLSVYRKLPLDTVQDLFLLCYNQDISVSMKEAISVKLREISLYSRITECAKTVQIKLSMKTDFLHPEDRGDFYSMLERFTDWRNVMTVISPDEVLTVMLKARDYETAKQWCQLKELTRDQYMNVVEWQLLNLLNGKTVDTTKAFLILEDLKEKDSSMCFDICNKLLDLLSHQREVLFVVSYMLKQLDIPENQQDEFKIIKIGSKAILCLPQTLQGEYSHLVKSPHLMLEQLLMNMKIDLAGQAFLKIKDELESIQNPVVHFNKDFFNKLVATYAKKALDFTVEIVPILEKDRSHSQMSNASSENTDLSNTPTKKAGFTESLKVQRRSVDITASPRPSISGPSGTPNGKLLFAKKLKGDINKFVMPSEPPPPDKWQPDNSTDTCMVCKVERFSMFNRRHHCRRCGRVVCGTCSSKKSTVNNVSVRTCDDCYQQIFGDRKQSIIEEEMYKSRGDQPSDSSLSRTLGPTSVLPVIQEDLSMADAIHHTQILWKLETDDEQTNQFTREDFYYEQAPSTSLCLSILGLHEDTKMSGQLMLQMCDDLSVHLKPIAPGVPNPEVDYSLLLSMMKTLLFHAKIKFTKSTKGAEGIAKCDVYQSRIDLLSVLVSDNFSDLPSLQELTKPEIVMRLRDSLIMDERLHLAVEVSTKCGLDPSGVWAAWGMNCLQSRDLAAAREKFSRCLKPPVDRNVIQSQPSMIIADIIHCLETMPSSGQGELQLLMASSGPMMNRLLSASMNFTEETATDSVPFQECLYYLKSYASFNIIIDFYRKNGYWMKAVQYIIDHRCSSEVFVEALLVPSISSGEWGKLVDQMVLTDPTLEKWNQYLKSTCKYLVKQKLHHILYEFQLIMKDFIRAAMTCVTCFYLRDAQSYLDLADRISFLYKAHQHLQSYMDPSQWGSVSRPISNLPNTGSWEKPSTESVRLNQDEEELGKHLKMIAIQIEVTKFLHHCLKNTESNATAIATLHIANSKSPQLPSMFGTNKVRTDLVNMILLSGNDIPAAFELGFRIIKECKLGGQAIYTHAARQMAKHQRYDHIRQLLECLGKAGLGEDDMIDEIIGACILVVSDNPNEAKEAENLIKLLRKDSNKINAYILCGKLRSAYLMAVKAERVEDVQRIAGAAQRMGQTAVKNICNKWLEQKNKS